MLCFWKGAALDFLPEPSKDAEKELSKAVKLEPSLVDAWNALGNLYWKKADLKGSKSCFVAALAQKKNAVSLRCLSMILRATKPETPQERSALLIVLVCFCCLLSYLLFWLLFVRLFCVFINRTQKDTHAHTRTHTHTPLQEHCSKQSWADSVFSV